jgi:hypothetical protein
LLESLVSSLFRSARFWDIFKMNLFNPPKKVKLNLVGLDSHAFSLMGAFRKQARKEGWSAEDIARVLDVCKQGDYDNLLYTLQLHVK